MLRLQVLMFLARLLCLTTWASSAAGASALYRRLGHAHYLFGDVVGFLFVGVARSIYGELWLNRYWCWSMDRYAAEVIRPFDVA